MCGGFEVARITLNCQVDAFGMCTSFDLIGVICNTKARKNILLIGSAWDGARQRRKALPAVFQPLAA